MALELIKTSLPAIGYKTFHSDANINYQLNRFLIPELESVFGEIASRVVTYEDWVRSFLQVARVAEEHGELAKASRLFRAAEIFTGGGDLDQVQTYGNFIRLFYESVRDPSLEIHEVLYADGTLHSLRFKPSTEAGSPTKGSIVLQGGFDSYVEDLYPIGKLFQELGFEVVMFDGPGQGSTLMKSKIPMTPQWEVPVRAVFDYFQLGNVTLIGLGLGGYLALRAAASEKRVSRVVSFDAMYDFEDCFTSRLGSGWQLVLKTLTFLKAAPLINKLAELLMKRSLLAKWGIDQGIHVMGAETASGFFQKLKDFHAREFPAKIRQDVLLLAGKEDHFIPLSQLSRQIDSLVSARSITTRVFTRQEAAHAHCQVGNMGLAVTAIVDWIHERSRAGS